MFLRGLALGLVLAVILVSQVRYRDRYAVKLLLFFAVGVSGYIVAPLLYQKTPLFIVPVLLSDSIALSFLLLAEAVFGDQSRPSRRSLIIGGIYLLMGWGSYFWSAIEPMSMTVAGIESDAGELLWVLSRILMLGLLAYSLKLIFYHWREDLVEPRRRLRMAVGVAVGLYILGIIFIESYLNLSVVDGVVSQDLEILNSLGLVFSSLVFLITLIFLGAEIAPEIAPQIASQITTSSPQETVLSAAEEQELEALARAMEVENCYRDMELSIGSLAQHLGIPEHRLRKTINRHLGYRNFNDFLNRYRIADAVQRLNDRENLRLPILTIAMDSGYRSMTTFNKAFKSIKGVTPSEYRQDSH